MLQGKRIVLGVTGSIAAYKAADLASKLTQAGAHVDVILTKEASQFITPLTFRSLTHLPVIVDLFDPNSPLAVEHVALAEHADIVVVAPATANVIAKMANGLADDALTCTLLATAAPVLIAPAMDGNMFKNPAVVGNLAKLKEAGVVQVGPATGRLASGLTGMGRMSEVVEIVGMIQYAVGRSGDLAGRKIVVSAGGTQEPIDPVRVITNRSSGKMGYAIAEAARDRGANVVLVTAAGLPNPPAIESRHVETVAEMREAVLSSCIGADAVVMAAAVSDFRPSGVADHKIKKGPHGDGLILDLVKNADFFIEVPKGVLRVGFAAESEHLIENAKAKRKNKDLDIIVANDVTEPGAGFSVDTNHVVILDRHGAVDDYPMMLKTDVASCILDRVAKELASRRA